MLFSPVRVQPSEWRLGISCRPKHLFFFWISNKFYWYQKKNTLVHKECTRGQTIQEQKLQESRKSRKEKNDWLRIAANQSNKVLKKNSLRFGMDLSLSSKHLLFLSFQRHHNKQWGKINHIYSFWWRPNLPY